MREEPEGARQNRGAAIGLFVFSKRTAPPEMESFNRYGNDIIVVWDAEDAASDVFYTAGLSVAKALCSRPNKSHSNETGADFDAVMAAILETERQAKGLEEIAKSAETIKSGSDRILNRARIMSDGFAKQIAILNDKVGGLREAVGGS